MLLRFWEFVYICLEVKKSASHRLGCLVPCHESGQNCKLCVSLKISWQSDWQPDNRNNESRNLSPGFVSVSALCLVSAHPYPRHPKIITFVLHCRISSRFYYDQNNPQVKICTQRKEVKYIHLYIRSQYFTRKFLARRHPSHLPVRILCWLCENMLF